MTEDRMRQVANEELLSEYPEDPVAVATAWGR